MSKSLIDVRKDLEDLAAAASILRQEIQLYELDAKSAGTVRELLSKSGLASDTTRLYGGCEKIMEYLAKTVDRAPMAHSEAGWHAGLLVRMSQPYPNVRGPIISEVLFVELNRLRGFRHRERSSYGRQLDGSIVIDRAREIARAAEMFRVEVEAFLQAYAAAAEPEQPS